MTTAISYDVRLRRPHPKQQEIRNSTAKRKVIRAGRRGGKTVIASQIAVEALLKGKRALYATPTDEQVDTFWREVKRALVEPIEAHVYYKNETKHIIEMPGTENRIRAKTAWNADTLRGDSADILILDEFQLMDETAWEEVGAPMLLDNNGDAIFIYTPPSLKSRSTTKARDHRYAAKMFQRAQEDTTGRWAAFHFSSHDNPYISTEALQDITQDMTALGYRQEIMAEDIEDVPGALWTRSLIDKTRIEKVPELTRVIIGVDPTGTVRNECGIVVAGRGLDGHGYILDDESLFGSPNQWADAVIDSYLIWQGDRIVGESNYGGDMVESTIQQAAKYRNTTAPYKGVQATRGKAVRAEPVVAMFEQGRVHFVGEFPKLEEEMCSWIPGETRESPNRVDAMVWALTELVLNARGYGFDF